MRCVLVTAAVTTLGWIGVLGVMLALVGPITDRVNARLRQTAKER